MASVAGRKKSIISSIGDAPVANNTLLNQAASQSTSLYQQCSSLRTRLMHVVDFSQFFTLASSDDSRQSTDPVTQLWDLFSLGTPLCYLYNLLPPPFVKIAINPDLDISTEKNRKRAIAQFSMQMSKIPESQPFTVTDLWDRNSTDGLVKVIHNVIRVVDRLPPNCFAQSPTTPHSALPIHESSESIVSEATPTIVSPNAREVARKNIIREILETERKYVQDLEIMQKYSVALSQSNQVDQDTIHYLFPNLNKLLNFQRKFLIRMESIADLPWPDQRWGSLFVQSEEEFVVYEPYCAHYTKATELMLTIENTLMELSHTINMTAMKGELPAFLIKPIQRVCKYPLLIETLLKAADPADYPHYEELQSGLVSVKRIADRINEAQRRSENEMTVKSLHSRVEDWKGHHLSNFGELLLHDIFIVTKSDVDREYHVFLFEKIILCCKEAVAAPPNSAKKVSKSNSILKKQQTATAASPTTTTVQNKKTSPLLLKGRIFLNNVTQVVPMQPPPNASPPQNPLAVWWRGDDDLEYFTLRCRTLDTMKQWESQINRLIKEAAVRRASDYRPNAVMTKLAVMNSTNPSIGKNPSPTYTHEKQSSYSGQFNSSAPGVRSQRSPPGSDDRVNGSSSTGGGPQGYPVDTDGFDHDDDDYEDYPPSSSYASSGRGTPIGNRRNNAFSMPPERDQIPGYDRPRAQTEDTNGPVMAQWRSHGGMPPPPLPSSRPTTPRLTSNASTISYASDGSFGNGSKQRPALRSQFSSTKLKSTYENGDVRSQPPMPISTTNRSRSASQPSAYVPKSAPPPLPTNQWSNGHASHGVHSTSKRGSGSSESSGRSSDYSPNSSSPITPFGSSDVSLGGNVGIRSSRSQNFDNAVHSHLQFMPPVKVKVHFNEDIFVIQVSRSTEYEDLVEKVGRKIRLCGPRRDDGPLRVKYRDEDGDMVSLGSTEDVQMAFEQVQQGHVTLYVT